MVHFITPEISITVRRNTVTLGIKGNTNNDKFGPAEMKIVSATLEKLAIDSQYSEFVFDVSKLEHFTQDELAYRLNHI